MYWLYLTLFTFVVFVPTVVRHGYYVFNTVQTQEFIILILGSVAFTAFIIQEKRLKTNVSEKKDIQRTVHRMAKDLTHSYSYIGEINRKFDILENITLGYPESLTITAKKQMETYGSIMEAIRLFGKSDEFALRFICMPNHEILKEVKSFPGLSMNFSLKNFDSDIQFFESDKFIVVNSPKAIDNIFSCIVLKKKTPNQKMEDLEMIRTLAAQALFFFMFVRDKKMMACNTLNPISPRN